MRVKEEYIPLNNSRKFYETFQEFLSLNDDILYLSQKIPYVNELRGKIWVICDFEYQQFRSAEGLFDWGKPIIQDYWQLDSEQMALEKMKRIKEHSLASVTGIKTQLYLNHCSGTGDFSWPIQIAKMMNKIILI
jgi:hypothetical protein